MPDNIEGLNEEESEWVCGVMMRIATGEHYNKKCPSEAAWNRFQDNITKAGMQDENIPYKN